MGLYPGGGGAYSREETITGILRYFFLKNIIIFRIVLLHLNNHINLVLKFMEDFKRRQEILVDAISREYLLPYSYHIL